MKPIRAVGVHVSEVIVSPAPPREIVEDWEDPFRLAVMVAVCADGIPAVVAENVADDVFAGTTIEGGTVRVLAELDKLTEAPLAAAGLDKVTVQVVLEFEDKVAAAHCSDEITVGAIKLRDVV